MSTPAPAFWHRRRVFVTGCTGFLGSWLVRELLARGAEVVGLVRDRVRDTDLVRDRLFRRITVVRGRVEDKARLETAFAVHGVETVFHLATPAVVLAAGFDDPTDHPAAKWTDTILSAVARSAPAAQVVVPVGLADDTGRVAVAGQFGRRTAVGVAALPRLFGGGDRTWSRLVPWTVQAVLRGRPVERPPDDEVREPYVYVQDAAHACLCSAEAVAADPGRWSGRPVPFAPDPALTGGDLVAALAEQARTPRVFLPAPDADDTDDHPALAAAGHPLGWGPAVRLADAVAATVGWYRWFLDAPRAVPGPAADRICPAA